MWTFPNSFSTIIFVGVVFLSVLCGRAVAQTVYRLSNTTRPLSYDIELKIDTDCEIDEFQGKVIIEIVALEEKNFITLHTGPKITLHSTKLYFGEDETEIVVQVNSPNSAEIRILELQDTNLFVDEHYFLEFTYTGELSNDNLGFYRSTYRDENDEKVCMVSTQFAPTQARRAFPCFDEPLLKADFNITITHPDGTEALSNEPEITSQLNEDGTITTTFGTLQSMSAYLVAFAVSDFKFEEVEDKKTGMIHKAYARRDELEHVKFALDYASKVYEKLLEYFNVQLTTLKELKQVAIPDFYFSAMENWGMITYKESRFLYNREVHPVNMEHSISNVIGHEITHHWFGDLVTMKWWTHVWLKEGFATLFSYYGQDYVREGHDAIQFLLVEKLQFVFTIDSDPEIRAMSRYIEETEAIMKNYDKIAYDKACCVLRMMDHAFGRENFKEALRIYLNSNKFDSTEEKDLFDAIQDRRPDLDVDAIMSSWTQQGGYPIVTATRDYAKSAITLKQERYLHTGKEVSPAIWWIPITIASRSDPSIFRTWMNESEKIICEDDEKIEACNDEEFFLINIEQTGYYRVNYDSENWNRIAIALRQSPNRIHVNNRAQLIDDAFNLALVGRLDYSTVFNLVQYISLDNQYAPWAAISRGIGTLKQRLWGESRVSELDRFVQDLVTHPYRNFGLSSSTSGVSITRSFARQLVIRMACEFGLQDCLNERRDYSHPDLREIYYCNRLRNGGMGMYSQLRNMLKNTTEPILREEIISALGCSVDRNQLVFTLLTAMDSSSEEIYKLTKTERRQLVQSVYRKSYYGVMETLNIIEIDQTEFDNAFLGKDLDGIYEDLAKYVNNIALSNKFTNVMENQRKLKRIVRGNLQWLADYGGSVFTSIPPAQINTANSIQFCMWLVISSFAVVRISVGS